MQARLARPAHVQLDVVADMQHLGGQDARQVAGMLEDAAIRFAEPQFVRGNAHVSRGRSNVRVVGARDCVVEVEPLG